MPLLICLTVASVSCQTLPADFPKPPNPRLKQPLIDQTICDSGGVNCRKINRCDFWRYDANTDSFVKIGSGPLKNKDPELSCHGSFALSAKEITAYKEYLKRVKYWADNNCAMKSKADFCGIKADR